MWLAWLACAHHVAPGPSWHFEPRVTDGDIVVMPVVAPLAPLTVTRGTWLGRNLDLTSLETRLERTIAVGTLPQAASAEFPGALNARIGREWSGRFRPGRLPVGGEDRIAAALGGWTDLDHALSDLARANGGSGTLFTWVDALEGTPLSATELPGDIVHTPVGPVVVDLGDEPYLVRARMGMALVASDGEVVLRYREALDTVISAQHGPSRAGRALADALADEVVRVWALRGDFETTDGG